MFRRVVVAAIVLIAAGALMWQFRHGNSHPVSPKSDGAAPAVFSFKDLNGNNIDSASLRGKVILVDFWATWCVPCESEIPHLVKWQQKYGARGLQVVGLSMDDTPGPVQPYMAKHGVQYPVAMADDKTIAAFGGVLGLPVNVIVGRDGKMLAKHAGVTDIAVLEKEVEQALAAQ